MNALSTNVIAEARFERIGGSACLDLANTLGGLRGRGTTEEMPWFAELLAFSHEAGLVSDAAAARLEREAARRPSEAAAAYVRATALREAIHGIFSAIAAGRPAPERDLALLNAELARTLPRARILSGNGGFAWGWAEPEAALDAMLGPLARSAAELLASDELERVRECAGDSCGWLFLDTSRNRSRRWCDMKLCGNRAKVRRFRRARDERAGA